MALKKASEIKTGPVITLVGSKGVGKTTTAVSASKNSPDVFPHKGAPVDCGDVVIIQSDAGGYEGALDAGMNPSVIDLSTAKDWAAWEQLFNKELKDLRQACSDGAVTAVAIDLTALDKLLRDEFIAKATIDSPKNWEVVTSKAGSVYKALRDLPNYPVIIGMVHPTVKAEMSNKADVVETMRAARDAASIGGERQLIVPDLAKGHQAIWVNNAAAQIGLMPKTEKKPDGSRVKTYRAFIESNNKMEAGSRWLHRLGPGPHEPHLRKMMQKLMNG
jgi:hypothetical protein